MGKNKDLPCRAWEPWKTHELEPPDLTGIDEPPCKHCKYWIPQGNFSGSTGGFVWIGVRCCHAEKMFNDFSCYREKLND